MNIYTTLAQLEHSTDRRVVAIGNFDGVHLGHQELLALVVEQARQLNVAASALTFSPHPTAYFRPDGPPFLLCKSAQKYRWMAQNDIDHLIDLTFNEALAKQSPEHFVQHILSDGLKAQHVIVGEDFRFGHRRAGDVEMLRQLCDALDMGCTIFDAVDDGEAVISSTRVREHVRRAQLPEAAALLGRPLEITGKVIHGDARGRNLGFPTANVDVGGVLMPPSGIYISTLQHAPDGPRRPACSYIGNRPTYGDGPITFETFILDVPKGESLDLYELDVRVELIDLIRPDKAFENSAALIEQMHKDIACANDYFGR